MTSARVTKGGPAYQELQRRGWKPDILATDPEEIWMNAPGRFHVDICYETDNGARLTVTDALALAEWRPDGLRGFRGRFFFEADDEDAAVKVVDHVAAIVKRCTIPADARLFVELFDCDESMIIYRLSLAAIIDRTH